MAYSKLITVALAIALCQSISCGPTMISSITPIKEQTCQPFFHHYCNRFNYYTALSPNPRQSGLKLNSPAEYLADADEEFSHFYRILNSQCSDKLGTLLCFIYFPFCAAIRGTIPGTTEEVPIFPCRSLCEEVTNQDSQCTKELKKYNITWADHFNCDEFMYKGKKVYVEPSEGDDEMQLCVNHTQAPWFPVTLKKPEPEPVTEVKGPREIEGPESEDSETEEPETEEPETEEPETEEPEPEQMTTTKEIPVCTPSCGACPDKCKIRRGASGGTFENNDYTFAAKVRVLRVNESECGRRKWTCELLQQFDIKSGPPACKKAPQMTDIFDILGDARTCEIDCYSPHQTQLESGKEYFIAGHYHTNECGAVEYRIAGSGSLVDKWKGKYAAKMSKFVSRGNRARQCS